MSTFGSERAARQNAVGSRCRNGEVHNFALDLDAACWTCAVCGEQRTLEGPDRKLPKLSRDAEERARELEAVAALEAKVAAAPAGQAIEEEEAEPVEERPRKGRRR